MNNKKSNSTKEPVKKNKKLKKIDESDLLELNEDIKEEKKITKASKNLFNTVEVIVIMVITVLFGIFIGSAVTYFRNSGSMITTSKDLRELVSTYYEVVDDYYGEINSEELLEAGIKGMMDYLNDPYSSYLDSSTAEEFNEKLEGEYVGLGAEVMMDNDGNLLVKTVFENSPADKCGLKVNDIIYQIDNTLVSDVSLNEVTGMIKGEVGTKAILYVKRGQETMELEFTRGTIEMLSVTGEIIEQDNEKIGLVTIEIFAKNSYTQFKSVVDDLQEKGINYLIIDIRNNTGGYLTTVKSIAEMFLTKGDVIFIVEDNDGQEKQLASKNGTINLPTAILINGGSASASEILAASLNENMGIELVGLQTYGKGTVQKTKVLSSGATIKYTTQQWLTPSGKSIEGEGISPTIEVEMDRRYYEEPIRENDNQLQTAINALLKKEL